MEKEILLETYVLQQDMRIRLPKQILNYLNAVKGETMFDIYLNVDNQEIVLRRSEQEKNGARDEKK